MKKKPETPCLLYCLPEKKVKKIVHDYIDYVMNPYHEWRQTTEWLDEDFNNGFTMGNKPAPEKYEHLPERQPLRQRSEFDGRAPIYQLEHKPQPKRTEYAFRALVDMLYRLYEQCNGGWFTLNASVLKGTFQEGYLYMLTALLQHGVIVKEYIHGTTLVSLRHPEEYELNDVSKLEYAYILPYRLRVIKILNEYTKKQNKALERRLIDTIGNGANTFLLRYQENLASIRFPDSEAIFKFINNWRYFKSEHRKAQYSAFVNKVNCLNGYLPEEKKEIVMGKNEITTPIGRYYHIGTSMPKKLKPFSNLLYGIDAHNSHPLLFNIFLFEYFINNSKYSINSDFNNIEKSSLYYLLSSFILLLSPYKQSHYVSAYLINKLNISNIDKETINHIQNIPEDVFRYIYDTSTGQIWDSIQAHFPQYTRSQVKDKCFRYVFYSYLTNAEGKRKKQWTSLFKECYPSVWKVINEYKESLHRECLEKGEGSQKTEKGKDKVQLSHLLMRFESVVFTRALSDAFQAKIPAIGIHDCIAVIGESIDKPQQERLQSLILNRYKEVGIIPALSVEEYS